jgi:hypothetical protein
VVFLRKSLYLSSSTQLGFSMKTANKMVISKALYRLVRSVRTEHGGGPEQVGRKPSSLVLDIGAHTIHLAGRREGSCDDI